MNKILINVYVPSLEKKYDIFIPINIIGSKAMDIIQNTIVDLSNGHYEIKEKVVLIDSLTCKAVNLNNIVKYSGLRNGSDVILL